MFWKYAANLQKKTQAEVWFVKLQSMWSSKATSLKLHFRCSPVNLLHIFRTPFSENTSGRLLLGISQVIMKIWARIWYSRIALKNSILQIHQIHLRLYSCLVLSHTVSCIHRWYFIAIFQIFWLQSSGNLQNSYF